MSSSEGTSVRTPSAITTPLVVVSAVFPVLSAIAIYLRILAQRKGRQPFHTDDGWIIAAWVLTLVLSCLVWVFTARSGIDYYKIDALHGTYDSLEMIFLASCIIQFPLSTVKISILLFYKRIFSASKPFAMAVWVAIITIVIWGFLFFFLVLTQVDPISDSWTGGRLRYDSTALGLAQVGTSIALDFIVLCYPLPVISQLHMASKRKVAVALIFWLGAFCGIAAIVRLVFLNQSTKQVTENESMVYLQSKQFIFMIIEPNSSIIAACLPCFGPLMTKVGGRGPQSMIRSVRSLFSLRSNRSKKSSLGGQSHNNGSFPPTDSQIELHWQGKSQQDVQCVADGLGHDRRILHNQDSRYGINVTNGVTVVRE